MDDFAALQRLAQQLRERTASHDQLCRCELCGVRDDVISIVDNAIATIDGFALGVAHSQGLTLDEARALLRRHHCAACGELAPLNYPRECPRCGATLEAT